MDSEPRTFVALDFETTGVNTNTDRIVQYCFIKLTPDRDGHSLVHEVRKGLVNPGMPIPKEATEVHHITDEMVKDARTFSKMAPHILPWLSGSTLVHFNGRNFDIPLLATEFERVGMPDHGLYDMPMIDVMILYRQYRSHSLSAAFKDVCGKDIGEDAHDAQVDVEATIDVMRGLSTLMGMSFDEMALKSIPEGYVDFAGKLKLDDDGCVIYTIGKAKGVRVLDDPGFGKWMLKEDFPNQTKQILRKLLPK